MIGKIKNKFGADYRVLNKAWNAISPDSCLTKYNFDYKWLSNVYQSVKPVDPNKGLIWASLGQKTIDLIHDNLKVGAVHDDIDTILMDATLIEDFIKTHANDAKTTRIVEINLVAKIQKHSDDPKFIKLGEKLEELREKHEQGLVTSIEFLKMLLGLAKEAAEAERTVVPEDEIDKGKAALTELFNGIRNNNTPIIVERVVADIDELVKKARFVGWQNTTTGKQEVKKALRKIIWTKYKIKNQEVFDKAYGYIEQYY